MEDPRLLNYVISHTDKKFDEVHERMTSIEEKVNQLLAFKWQIIGGSVVLSVIINVLLSGAKIFFDAVRK